MLKNDASVLSRFNQMLELGYRVLATRRPPARNHFTTDFVDVQLANQWFTSSLSLIARTFGKESEHYTNMSKHYDNYPKWPNVEQAFGVLLAAKDDLENGALFDFKTLVTAELFDEFLDQAKILLDNGYFAPSAVLIGAVLEDSLRKICEINNIHLPDKPKLDYMNAELAKIGTLNKLTQKQITVQANIRNSAAHGKWDEFSKQDVVDMLNWTRQFMENNFA